MGDGSQFTMHVGFLLLRVCGFGHVAERDVEFCLALFPVTLCNRDSWVLPQCSSRVPTNMSCMSYPELVTPLSHQNVMS